MIVTQQKEQIIDLQYIQEHSNELELITKLRNKTLSEEETSALKVYAEKACRTFHSSPKNWLYQLQLLYNAYLTEKCIENVLSDEIERKRLFTKLQQKFNSIKDAINVSFPFHSFGKEYVLTDGHDLVYKQEDRHKVDFILKENSSNTDVLNQSDLVKTIELKATVGTCKFPFYQYNAPIQGADVVLVVLLDRLMTPKTRNIIYVMFRTGGGSYTPPSPLIGYRPPTKIGQLDFSPIQLLPTTIKVTS